MENCLVTKLESAVNNDNLMRLGEFAFIPVTANGNIQFGSNTGDNVTVRLIGDGYLSTTAGGNEGKEITLNGAAKIVYYYVNSGSCKLFMQDNYKLTNINGITGTGIDIGILKYRENLAQVIGSSVSYGSLDGNGLLKNISLIFRVAENKDVYINTNVFAGNTEMKQCRIYGTSSYGSILNFASATKLTYLWLSGTDITGTLESLLEVWAGNKTTTCNISVYHCGITLNSQSVSVQNIIASFSGNNITLMSNDNIIATYNGSTWTYNS